MYWDIQDGHDLINRERVKKRKVAVSDLAQLIQEDGLESKVLATKTGSDVSNILTCWYKPTNKEICYLFHFAYLKLFLLVPSYSLSKI